MFEGRLRPFFPLPGTFSAAVITPDSA